MIIPDNETEVDLLYYEAISKTITDLLSSAKDAPLTIGVHGDWGAGKSSILKMIESEYESDEDTLCIAFNGWVFQGFEDTKAVLIETIVKELLLKYEASATLTEKARKLLERVNWMKFARKVGGLAFTAVETIIEAPKGLIGKVSKPSGTGIEDPGSNTIPDHVHAFREEFADLLKEAKVKHLIVTVDDLDRCLPKTSIETLEAIRLFLFVPGTAFVIAADEAMVEYAVKKHFPDLPLSTGPASYAQNYLEKLIQVPFRIPPLGYVETRTYIILLMSQLALGSSDDSFLKLKTLAQGVLRKPWVEDGFGRTQINEALGAIPAKIEEAIQLAGRVAPILAEGTHGNPRQIKRFLNMMKLRLAIAERRAILDDITIPVLSKLMLAERFDTGFYDKISREAIVDGKSSTLRKLESSTPPLGGVDSIGTSKSKGRKTTKAAKTVETDQDETELSEWSRRWARLEPTLGDVDLRPYLFISRDRKPLFSSGASLPQMEAWVEKLCGGRLEAKAAATEVNKLPSGELERYFNAVLDRVQGAKDLSKRPPGVFGLIEICKLNPYFQSAIVQLLESLTPSNAGPWIAVGWDEILITHESEARFKLICEKWAEQDENKPLKAAAVARLSRVVRLK